MKEPPVQALHVPNCQDNEVESTQAYGGVFPGSPPLDAGKYSKCYGMQLDGYVQVAATAGITSSSAGLDTSSYANRFRVCARFSGHADVTLNGVSLDTSSAGNYDATLVCHDVPYLPAGLLPLSVQFASGPNDINNVFQLWIIPVKSITQVADPPAAAKPPSAGVAPATESPTAEPPAAKPATGIPSATTDPPAAEPPSGLTTSATAEPPTAEPAATEPATLAAAPKSPVSATAFTTPIAASAEPSATDISAPATARVNGTALAVTNAAAVPVAVVCNTSVPLSFQGSDFVARGVGAGANATVTAVADVTSGANADITTCVIEVSVDPAYETNDAQGGVAVQFAASSVRSKKGPRVLVSAAPLTYSKQQAALPVMTTAAEYL
ncbi:hypothetical protein WJX75_009867 [Coccomyxa subellipsoidea]|uniref:HYR domain-containing protein n=1 Tax=Coccomyxa subellipsoidea TaxID=248742 RepID=A0ABR2YB74_9CHLO